MFLVALPQTIDTLVEIETTEPTDIIVHLPDSIEPFTVQFAVWDKKSKIKIPTRPNEFLGNGVIVIGIDNLEFGLAIMLVNINNTSQQTIIPFPPRTCYIVR